MEPIRIDGVEIGGAPRQLVCKPWPYREGRRWLTRLLRVLGAQASAGGDVDVAGLLEGLSDDFLDELLDTCERHTDVVTRTDAGATAQPFSAVTPLLAGRYEVTLQVARAHVELNFGPFFASLESVLAGLGGAGAAEGAGASSS